MYCKKMNAETVLNMEFQSINDIYLHFFTEIFVYFAKK